MPKTVRPQEVTEAQVTAWLEKNLPAEHGKELKGLNGNKIYVSHFNENVASISWKGQGIPLKNNVDQNSKTSWVKIAGALGAIAAVWFVGYLTSKTMDRLCFVNPNESSVAYCADLVNNADPSSGIYEEYKRIDVWVPSDKFTKHTYEQVQGIVGNGMTFVQDTVRKYFGNLFG